jgi:hypothetical protein
MSLDSVINLLLDMRHRPLTIFKALASPKSEEYAVVGENFPDWLFLLRGSRHIIEITRFHEEEYAGPLVPFLRHGKRRWMVQHDPKKTRPELLGDRELLCSSFSRNHLTRQHKSRNPCQNLY